jgi:cytochrome c oxidase assembly protein subunit 15
VGKPLRLQSRSGSFLEMTRSTNNPWLTRFAVFTVLATFVLIGAGGIVTSKEAGMAVPDWPNSYGYNMFLFPVSKWIGGIFFEHVHRLAASCVGFLTLILAGWIWAKDARRWLRNFGFVAVFAVILQGVLGGLRVVLKTDNLGIPHAALAQSFLCLLLAIAVFLSQWWQRLSSATAQLSQASAARMRGFVIVTTAMIFVQLMLGATMRHQHAGLAVPDFPLAYGKIWPATDPTSIDLYNRTRIDVRDFKPITPAQIYLHMAHRIMALFILLHVFLAYVKARKLGSGPLFRRLTSGWLAMILVQAGLGVVTVYKNKPADIATAHVVVGAASLAFGVLISMMLVRLAHEPAPLPAPGFNTALAGSRG